VDPLRIVVRVVFAYVVLLVLVRLGGKRAITQANPFDFTLALILGELFDDFLMEDASAAMFAVASAVLMAAHVAMNHVRARAGAGG
jgi:uncharacterized membrane protein YcaP (DUF421 family)